MLISSLIWICTVCPDLSVRKLRIITVVTVCPSILSPDTYFIFFPGGNTFTLLCHLWANWCHNATKESTCNLWTWASESQSAKGAGFNKQKTVSPTSMMFPRWKLLNWKIFADPMELMRLIRKRLNKFSYVMFWDCQPLVMQSQNLKF